MYLIRAAQISMPTVITSYLSPQRVPHLTARRIHYCHATNKTKIFEKFTVRTVHALSCLSGWTPSQTIQDLCEHINDCQIWLRSIGIATWCNEETKSALRNGWTISAQRTAAERSKNTKLVTFSDGNEKQKSRSYAIQITLRAHGWCAWSGERVAQNCRTSINLKAYKLSKTITV